MDLVTHSLTGVMLARVLRVGDWRKTALLVGAANLPDIDIVTRAWGVLPYLEYHRGYTHSLLAAPLLAGAVVVAVRRGLRGEFRIWAASLAAILLHLAMDAMNVHGVGLLLPFSDRWIHLDAAFPTDPLIVLPMLFALAMPPLLGLIGSTVSQRKEATPKRGFAWFALVVVTLYCGGRLVAHHRAVEAIRELAAPGADAIYAFPMRFSLFQWRGVVERDEMTAEVPLDLATGQYRVQQVSPRRPEGEPVEDVLIASPEFQFALRFAEVPIWVTTAQADVKMLRVIDLRFGPSFDPQFSAEAVQRKNGIIEGGRLVLGPGFE